MLPTDWIRWTADNLARGVPRASILNTLLAEGFPVPDISESVRQAYQDVQLQAKRPVRELMLARSARWIKYMGTGGKPAYLINDLLSEMECQQLIEMGRRRLQPSTILGDAAPATVRPSRTSHIGAVDSDMVLSIDQRICDAIGLPLMFSEPLQLHYYEEGQFFSDHTDYLPEGKLSAYDARFGQRTLSVVVFLNTVEAGGRTTFPKLDLSFAPQMGSALVWSNLDDDFRPDPMTLHCSTPLNAGFKAILTKWFRLPATDDDSWYPGEPMPPKGTPFEKRPAPRALVDDLARAIVEGQAAKVPETDTEAFLHGADSTRPASFLVPVGPALKERAKAFARETFLSLGHENLSEATCYGVREYMCGCQLDMHFDRKETHHVLSLIHI